MKRLLLLLIALTCLQAGCYTCPRDHPHEHEWAEMVGHDIFRVTEDLYRGPAPKKKHYARLRELGVRTIVSTRLLHDQEDEARQQGFDYTRLPIKIWDFDDEPVQQFLRLAQDPEYQPMYVHCSMGVDRVGLLVASYRVVLQSWPRDEALCELTRPEADLWLWQNVVSYIRRLDVEKMRAAVSR